MATNKRNGKVPLERQTGAEAVLNFNEWIEALPLEQRMAFDRERAHMQAQLDAECPDTPHRPIGNQSAAQAGKQRPRRRGRKVPRTRDIFFAKLKRAWERMIYPFEWVAQALRRLHTWASDTLPRAACAIGHMTSKVSRQVVHHLLAPLLCFICIFVGTCLSALLPASLWATFALPPLAQWTGLPLSAFPLAHIPELTAWFGIMLVALPIAVVVFREGAFSAWQASSEPLLARMLYAVAAGIRWPKVWFRWSAGRAKA